MPPDPAKIAAAWGGLKATAPPRFDRFEVAAGGDPALALCWHRWNMEMGSAIMPALNTLEVGLRNSVHNALTALQGRPDWYNDPHFLDLNEQGKILNAKRTLQRLTRPMDPGRIVAELTLGFWVGLMSQHYEHTIWRPAARAMFPALPRSQRTRRNVSDPLHRIRILRNRVSHHEPICFMSNLGSIYREVLRVIDWVDPLQGRILQPADRFDTVFTAGVSAFLADTETRFG